MEQTGIFESNSKILNEIERLKNEQSSLRQVVDCLYLETRKPVSISKKGQEVPNKLFKSDEEEYREPVYSKCESIIKEKTGEYTTADTAVSQAFKAADTVLDEKKADKSDVETLKSKVHTLESQVEKLLKSNEELSKSNDLRVSQLQSTLIALQGTGSTPSQTKTVKKPELGSKTPPKEYDNFVINGLQYDEYSNSNLPAQILLHSTTQDKVDKDLDIAQKKTLSSLKELYSISLNKSPVPDEKNNLFKLYEGIYNKLTKLNSDAWKNCIHAPESRKKFIYGIISQVIINTFFDMLTPSNEYDPHYLKNEIQGIKDSGLFYQNSEKKIKTVLEKIKEWGDEYDVNYGEYVELADNNINLFFGYKKILTAEIDDSSSSPRIILKNYGDKIITTRGKDELKEIISGGKSVSAQQSRLEESSKTNKVQSTRVQDTSSLSQRGTYLTMSQMGISKSSESKKLSEESIGL